MAVTVRLPGSLREVAGGQGKVEANGRTLREVIDDLERRYPGMREKLIDAEGRLQTYVNVFIGDREAREMGGATAAVPDGGELMVIPAMAGGGEKA